MNTAVDEAAIRVRTLHIALQAILQCCQEVEEPSAQIASAIFLATELSDAIERLVAAPHSVLPAND